jgi:hypothetical protein
MPEHEHEPGPEPGPAGIADSRQLAPLGVRDLPRALTRLTPGDVLKLQRMAGNAAVTSSLRRERRRLVPVAEAASKLRAARDAHPGSPTAPGVRFRLPAPDELKRIYASGTTPQNVVEEGVRRALRRMDADWDLRTGADDVMHKLFPTSGKFDETAWAGVLGTDTDDVYRSAADAEARLRPADKARLQDVARAAADEIDKAMADTAGLKQVFGSQAGVAKDRYAKAKAALKQAMANSDTAIDTDYNRDDPQVGLGGWANFASQHIHLTGNVAEVTDRNKAIITLIHESCHLSNPNVDDRGYYGSDGFEAMTEAEKVNNAAHYEELPARSLGTSRYATTTFTPGQTAGGPVTFEDKARRAASEYLRKAWDAAVDAHQFVRNVAKAMQKDPRSGQFKTHQTSLIELSTVEQLTIHRQVPGPTEVTALDLSLSEGVAHATSRIKRNAAKQTVPATTDENAAVDAIITGSIADYGELLGNAAGDRQLMDWLVKHYRKGF